MPRLKSLPLYDICICPVDIYSYPVIVTVCMRRWKKQWGWRVALIPFCERFAVALILKFHGLQELKESFNYGLFCPPVNGKAGKFLDEERRLGDYPFNGPVGYLEVREGAPFFRFSESLQPAANVRTVGQSNVLIPFITVSREGRQWRRGGGCVCFNQNRLQMVLARAGDEGFPF